MPNPLETRTFRIPEQASADIKQTSAIPLDKDSTVNKNTNNRHEDPSAVEPKPHVFNLKSTGSSMKKMVLTAFSLQAATGVLAKPTTPATGVCLPEHELARTHPIPNGLPGEMLAHYLAVRGTKERDPLYIMNKVLVNGEIQPDAFEEMMTEVPPKALFDAMNKASWCGSRSSELVESMRVCLEEIREKNPQLSENVPTTRPPTEEEAAQVNIARLAFARIFGPYVGVLDRAVIPVEMASTLLRPTTMGWTAYAEHPEKVYKHIFIKEGFDANVTIASTLHELLHGKTHRAVRAVLQGFIEEGVTEFLATHEFSKDTHDTGYEAQGSNELVQRFVDTMGKSGEKLYPGSFEAGMEFLKLAYLSADTEGVQKLASAVESGVKEWKAEMESRFAKQPSSSKSSNVLTAIYVTAFIAIIGSRCLTNSSERVNRIATQLDNELSDGALKLIRIAAFAADDFDADLANRVLGSDAQSLDISACCKELENAGLMTAGKIADYRIAYRVAQHMPPELRNLVEGNVETHLENRRAGR